MELTKGDEQMKSKRNIVAFIAFLVILAIVIVQTNTFIFVSVPKQDEIVSPAKNVRSANVQEMAMSDPKLHITDQTVQFGREAFYRETFGNEVLFTDIMGVFNGAFTIKEITKATLKLRGQGTTNLKVKLTKTVHVGDRTFRKGEMLDTGLDVAKGSYIPLGITAKVVQGDVKIGVSCIMCHAVFDPSTKKVIEGVPNPDINVGTILALGTNSSTFFTHTEVSNLRTYMNAFTKTNREITTSTGQKVPLPDQKRLEQDVDKALLAWPPGYVDTMIDLKNDPVNIPDSFTHGDFPYSWNGLSPIGPLHGLVFLSGIPHGQNMDPLSQVPLSKRVYGIDPELFLGTMLQNASNPKFRYTPKLKEKPTQFYAKVDPTPGVAGVNHLVPTPVAPKSSFISLVGMIASKPGYKIAEHLIGMAAFQNTLFPTQSPVKATPQSIALGEETFRKANCMSCHAGDFKTNNRIISQEIIGTEPARAGALKAVEKNWGENLMYNWDTRVPLDLQKGNLQTFRVPYTTPLEDIDLTLAWGKSSGGYKVPSLLGLYWSPPYLHDGGVAVGANEQSQLGIPGTLYDHVHADPFNSLRALVDRNLREKVMRANANNDRTQRAHITGAGHTFWVDQQAGYTKEQQQGLINYLLKLTDNE